MFSGRWRRRKHVCELDVPWMFNQERQNCRGAQGWIGRCGLPRPPPSALQLPAEPRQLLLPAPPPGSGRWPCPACPICEVRIWGCSGLWGRAALGCALRVLRLRGQSAGEQARDTWEECFALSCALTSGLCMLCVLVPWCAASANVKTQ